MAIALQLNQVALIAQTAMTAITQSRLFVYALLHLALFLPASASGTNPDECGLASVYSNVIEETASGEDTQAETFTAAHRTLPFGTLVHIANQKNGRWTVVRITDRGPFIKGRIVDVSQIAARDLGFTGLTQVCLVVLWIPQTLSLPLNRPHRGN
jgi:rare lipoprotein A